MGESVDVVGVDDDWSEKQLRSWQLFQIIQNRSSIRLMYSTVEICDFQ